MSRYNMRKYPYSDGKVTPETKYCRFMDVDLDDFLGRVAEKVMTDCPIGIYGEMKKLHEAASSGDPDDRRVIWHVSNYGTNMIRERETFIQDTPAYNYMTKDKRNSPAMHGYIIEVKGYEGNILRGNVFEAGDHGDYAWHIKKTALPLRSVTLKYATGLELEVEHYEYARDYKHYMHERGAVTGIEYHPLVGMTGLPGLLHKERMERMELPVGWVEEHMVKLGGGTVTYSAITMIPPLKPSIADRLAVAGEAAKTYNEQNKNKKTDINMKKEII